MHSLHPPTSRTRAARCAWAGTLGLAASMGVSTARAELVAIEQPASGMECPECTRGLRMAIRALDGVDAIETSWNRRLLTARFRAGSRATLEAIRGMIRARHFVPLEAQVTVRGTLVPAAQAPQPPGPRRQGSQGQGPAQFGEQDLRVSGSGICYRLKSISEEVATRLTAARGHAVVIRGRVPAPAAGGAVEDPLLILVDSVEVEPAPANALARRAAP